VSALVVVLVKGFDQAKTRLSPAVPPARRRELAARYAELAMRAAGPGAVVVAGSADVVALAGRVGLEAILEDRPSGQNPAARRGVELAIERRAPALLLLSSDLPLVTPEVIADLLAAGERLSAPAVLAAPAGGRGGTNALYLKPPGAIDLHFGDQSLAKFAADAHRRGARFELFQAPELALDVDEPADLQQLPAAG
jgi:2-phospho-L-lactate guanylyltransferase